MSSSSRLIKKIFTKPFPKNYVETFLIKTSKVFLPLLFAALFSGCTDQGCIEADDFGEYQTQTLEVNSNATEDSCKYDSTLDLFDSSQGSGLKTCFTSGSITVSDESGSTQFANGGCNGSRTNASGYYLDASGRVLTNQSDPSLRVQMDAPFVNLCVNNCINSCRNGSSSTGGVSNPEPNWMATDSRDSSQNFGVQIIPGSQIAITALGAVTLSNSANYPNVFIPVDALDQNGQQQNYSNSAWSNNLIFDVAGGQSFNVKFSGLWKRPPTTGTISPPAQYYNTSAMGGGSEALETSTEMNTSIHNGGISLVAYTIPHPKGYNFDSSQSDELSGTKGVPLLPEPRVWNCNYDPNATTIRGAAVESACLNKAGGYTTLGYDPEVDTAIGNNRDFKQIGYTSLGSPPPALETYGGIIRWSGDNLRDSTYDPSLPAYAASFSANYPISQDYNSGPISSDSAIEITNSNAYAEAISFRASCGGSGNGIPVTAIVKNPDNSVAKSSFTITLKNSFPTNNNSSGATNFVTLEPGQIINVSIASGTFCENQTIEWRFHKYLDIPISRSGFVKFTTLNGVSGDCTLNGRILNKLDSSGKNRVGNDPDFYEYDDFYTSNSKDPFNSLSVRVSSSTGLNWSDKIFVRKGQTIRLSPLSWNGTVSVNNSSAGSTARQCGIGMAMYITPRPALLCKGIAEVQTLTHDSKCLVDVDLTSGNLIGCQAYSSSCSDSNSSSYCPYPSCQSTISCTPGNASNNYTKTNCVATDNTNSTDCNNALAGLGTTDKTTTKLACGNSKCGAQMLAAARLSAMPKLTVDQCYDLENYTGKATDIRFADGAEIPSSDPIFSKGAAILSDFNGYYGNFSHFKDTGTTDSFNSNKIYQANNMLTLSQNSRLKFLILTNDDSFRKLDRNYSSSSTTNAEYPYSSLTNRGNNYNGKNGMKLNFEGSLQFNNGQWLEARLCREDNNHSCRGFSIPYDQNNSYDAAINAQPHLVELDNNAGAGGAANISSASKYAFDAFGILIRTKAPGTTDCNISGQAVDTQVGSPFYCHTYLNSNSTYIYDKDATQQFSDSQYGELNKLRLTFKIKDPETPDCKILCSKTTNGTILDGYIDSNGNCGNTASTANNGVTLPNPAYQNGTCSGNTSGAGRSCAIGDGFASSGAANPCCKQFYCASPYANNYGKYYVTVKVANPPGSNISNIIGGVITPVIEVMDGKRSIDASGNVTTTMGQAQRIYTLLVGDSRYQAILTMSMSMMILFYGVTQLMGLTDLSSSDLINRAIKIALIYFFASPDGWHWFNMFAVKWFKDGTDYLAFMMASSFDDSPALAKAISLNDYYDKSVLFSSVDKVFGMFFAQAVQKKISALLFASIFGFIYLWIIYLSFFLYVYAVGYAVLYYLTAQIFISILFTLGPIFFIFTLFNQTKGMFDNWLKQLIGLSLQQIFLLTTLAFFNMMMYEVLKMSLGYKICWDEVWTINIITRISLLSFWTVASLPPVVNPQAEVGDIGHPEGIPSLFSILFIWVIASLMNHFIKFMVDLGASIGGSLKASDLSSGISKTLEDAYKTSSEQFENISKGMIGEPIKRLDAALFDSGEHAEVARKKRQDENRQNQNKKDSLMKAGNEAMSTYKRDNADAYSKMTEPERKENLLKAREAGIAAEAKKLGIKDEDLAKLKSDKGLKYEGSNVLIAAAQAARQKAGFGGGTLNKSMDEAKINTKMSFHEASEGMKKMDKDQRAEFTKKSGSGDVKVGRSVSQKVIGTAQTAATVAVSPAAGTLYAAGGLAKDTFQATRAGLGKISGSDLGGNTDFKSTRANIDAAYKGAGAAKDQLKSNASKVMGKAKSGVGLGKYDKARQELEESGEIKKMSPFTNWARNKAEKQKIQERTRENREAAKLKMPTVNSSTTLSKLASLERGLNKDEANKTTLTAISSAIFGAGGLKNAVRAQSDKFGSAKQQFKSSSLTTASEKIGAELGSTTTQKQHMKDIRDNAQKAATAIKQVNDLEQKKKEATNPKDRQEYQEQINGIIERDSRPNGGSGYFEDKKAMEDHRAKYEATTTTEPEKSAIKKDMDAITGNATYIESQGNPLNRANAIYQKSDQNIATLSKKINQMSITSNAMQKSSGTFSEVMSSQKAKSIKANYDNGVGRFAKMTGGLFSGKDTKDKIKDHKKLESFRKDYEGLKNLGGNRDLNIRKTGTVRSIFGAKNNLEGKTKTSARHEDFMQKHQDLIKDANVDPSMVSRSFNPLHDDDTP